MGILEQLRMESQKDKNIFGRTKLPKNGALLYQAARMHDAEDERKSAIALAAATERAALTIIGRYDPEAASDFYAEVQLLKKRYLV